MILKKRNADALVGLDRGEAHGDRNCRDGKTVIATDDAARIREIANTHELGSLQHAL